jgi:hypothetical protein
MFLRLFCARTQRAEFADSSLTRLKEIAVSGSTNQRPTRIVFPPNKRQLLQTKNKETKAKAFRVSKI